MIKVKIEAQLPEANLEGFLRVIREWDGGRSPEETGQVVVVVDDSDGMIENPLDVMRRMEPRIPNEAVIPWNPKIQTRDINGALAYFDYLHEALTAAHNDGGIWKISFDLRTERVRLTRAGRDVWVLEQLMDEVRKSLARDTST